MASRKQFQAVFPEVTVVSATVDPASLADGAGETIAVSAPGVAVGDAVIAVAPGVDLQDISHSAYVAAADSIELRLQNESGAGPTDLASSTWKFVVAQVGPDVA